MWFAGLLIGGLIGSLGGAVTALCGALAGAVAGALIGSSIKSAGNAGQTGGKNSRTSSSRSIISTSRWRIFTGGSCILRNPARNRLRARPLNRRRRYRPQPENFGPQSDLACRGGCGAGCGHNPGWTGFRKLKKKCRLPWRSSRRPFPPGRRRWRRQFSLALPHRSRRLCRLHYRGGSVFSPATSSPRPASLFCFSASASCSNSRTTTTCFRCRCGSQQLPQRESPCWWAVGGCRPRAGCTGLILQGAGIGLLYLDVFFCVARVRADPSGRGLWILHGAGRSGDAAGGQAGLQDTCSARTHRCIHGGRCSPAAAKAITSCCFRTTHC